MKKKHYLISGTPHIGKTTALLRVREGLRLPSAGFHTESVYEHERKTGLQLVTSGGGVFAVADQALASPRVGKYGVNVAQVDRAIHEALSDCGACPFFYVDEIGTLLCQSSMFMDTLNALFDTHHVIGTVARHGHVFVGQVRRRPDVDVIELDASNRDAVVPELIHRLHHHLEISVG